MDNKKVSIIVPVYNVERFLTRCIDSLLAQTYRNLELIFVDDGSTDNSLIILQQANQRDNRIKVFSQENSGPSAARNKGIEVSAGDYIMFCDSDDEVSPDWCEKLVEGIEKYPDVWIMCPISVLDENGKEINRYDCANKDVVLTKDNYYMLFQKGLSGSIYNKIYSADIIRNNNISFDLNYRRGEDVIFNLEYIKHINGFVIVEDAKYLYYRYESVDTLTNKQYADDFEVYCTLYEKRLPFISERDLFSFRKHYWNTLFNHMRIYMDFGGIGFWAKVKKNNQRLRRTSFAGMLESFGESEMHPMCFSFLRKGNYFGYWLLEKIYKIKNKLF